MWIKEPEDILSQEGEILTIECLASGVPAPSIKWTVGRYFENKNYYRKYK